MRKSAWLPSNILCLCWAPHVRELWQYHHFHVTCIARKRGRKRATRREKGVKKRALTNLELGAAVLHHSFDKNPQDCDEHQNAANGSHYEKKTRAPNRQRCTLGARSTRRNVQRRLPWHPAYLYTPRNALGTSMHDTTCHVWPHASTPRHSRRGSGYSLPWLVHRNTAGKQTEYRTVK